MKAFLYYATGLLSLLQAEGLAMDASEIPAVPSQDSIMAGPRELQGNAAWAERAFTGTKPACPIPLDVRKQDFSVLRCRSGQVRSRMATSA